MVVLALLLACGTALAPPAAPAAPPAPAAPRAGTTSLLPPIAVRDAAFRDAGIVAELDRIGADDFDRDRLHLRAQARPAAALPRLYPWMTARQARLLKRAIDRPVAVPAVACGASAGR